MVSNKTKKSQGTPMENWSKALEKYGFGIYSVLLIIIVFPLLCLGNEEWLIRIESKSLFIYDATFFNEIVLTPGGLLSYISLFLTQFLHSPFIGAALFTTLLWTTALLTKVTFGISTKDSILAFIPSALLLIMNTCTGYALYTIKTPGFFFMPTVGYLISTMVIWGIGRIKSPVLSIPSIIIWCFLGYLGIGIYALIATLAASICQIKKECITTAKVAIILSTLLFVVFTPLIAYNAATTANSIADILTVGIPDLTENQTNNIFGTSASLLVAAPILYLFYRPGLLKNPVYQISFNGAITLFIIGATYLCWFKDYNFKAEIAMSNAIDNNNWKEVCNIHKKLTEKFLESDRKAYNKLAAKVNSVSTPQEMDYIVDEMRAEFFEPSRTMVQLKNLALVKLGTEANQAFTFKDGGRPQQSKNTIPMTLISGKQLYLHYGLPYYAYRWCIEEAVEYGWNVDNLKYATLSCILTDNFGVADKFLDKLESTLYHKRWAKEMRKYISNPDLIEQNSEFQDIKALMCYDSKLNNDQALIETYLIKHFTTARPENATAKFDKVAMLWALQTQDIPTFWRCFSNYIQTNDTQNMPRHYQEAALLYGNLEKNIDISNMPFDKAITASYDKFNRYSSQQRVRSTEESKFPFYEQFGNTFFYYYYFIRNLNTY